MYLSINPTNNNQNFSAVKMRSKERSEVTKLLKDYIKAPSAESRERIFAVMDPYIQRHSKEISSDKYSYDDVLQIVRLRFLGLLDYARTRQTKFEELTKSLESANKSSNKGKAKRLREQCEKFRPIDNSKAFKVKLIHYFDVEDKRALNNVKIAQKDENFIPWHRLSEEEKELLIPADRLEHKEVAETLEMFIKETPLNDYERFILGRYAQGYTTGEIANMLCLSKERVKTIFNKSVKRIRSNFGIEPR